MYYRAQVAAGHARRAPTSQSARRTGEVFCLLLSVRRLSLFRPPWLPWHLWLHVSLGWEGVEGLARTWAWFTTSLVSQIKKAEMDRKTLDWEIVELTNKLLDAKNTINKLEELNVCAPPGPSSPGAGSGPALFPRAGLGSEPRLCLQERYRLDCNLAVQLLKCNKSHFRNHKFADVSTVPTPTMPVQSFWDSSNSGFCIFLYPHSLPVSSQASQLCHWLSPVCCQGPSTRAGAGPGPVGIPGTDTGRGTPGSHAGRREWPELSAIRTLRDRPMPRDKL